MATSAMRVAPPRSSSIQRKSSGNFSEQGGKAASVRGLAFSYTWSTNVFSASRTCHWPLELSSHALQIWPIQQLRTDGASQVTVRLTTAKCECADTSAVRPTAPSRHPIRSAAATHRANTRAHRANVSCCSGHLLTLPTTLLQNFRQLAGRKLPSFTPSTRNITK